MNDRVIAILYEIIKSLRRVSGRTRLMKMVYLVDYLTAQKTGHPATGIKWSGYVSGPFSSEVIDTLRYMDGRLIEEDWYTDTFGDRHYIYSIPEGDPWREPPALNDPEVEKILKRVIHKWGTRPIDELLDYVYATEPFKDSSPGGDIMLDNLVAR